MSDELDLADVLAVADLKKLRWRSMSNPRWRDARFLSGYLKRRYLKWADDSPLDPKRLAALDAVARYRRAAKQRGYDLDAGWASLLTAIDDLIAEAERVQGHAIEATP